MTPQDILTATGINKSFGGVHALKGANLSIRKGETHCLAGENGSGKSTLIKVIAGIHKPDSGSLVIDGQPYPSITPKGAIDAGIQVIYQDFSIFPNLSVVENLALNTALRNRQKVVSRKQFRQIAQSALEKIQLKVDPDALVGTLPVADKQLIAIARALMDDLKLLIMDEPTTALTKNEIDRLFRVVQQMKSEGVTILFVSHKLNEVFEISDRITVLRNGENVITCPASEMDEDSFTHHMTGRSFAQHSQRETQPQDNTVLSVQNLNLAGSYQNINFELHQGEILGIAGQLGSGRTELAMTLFGMHKPTSGTIQVQGQPVQRVSMGEMAHLGIAYLPEDRLTEGLFLPQSITRNITVTRLDQLAGTLGVLKDKTLQNEAQHWIDELSIATSDASLPVQTLSGGNQQKVVLGRWLASGPKILVLNGPTVGVDIGAKHDIHELLRQLSDQGVSIVVVSDDAAELMAVCNRVLVMKGGALTAEMAAGSFSLNTLLESIV